MISPVFLRPLFAVFLALGVISPPAFSLGRRDKLDTSGRPPAPQSPASVPVVTGPGGELIHSGDQVEFSGRVRLVGSEPFPDLVLSDGTGEDWYLEGPSRQVMQVYEQRTLKVRGRVELRELVLANGRSLGFRRFLRDVEILEQQQAAGD